MNAHTTAFKAMMNTLIANAPDVLIEEEYNGELSEETMAELAALNTNLLVVDYITVSEYKL